MEQLWLVFSLLSLVTGFGLIVALLLLKRLAPQPLPPVVLTVAALLVMGLASFFGVYLRVLDLPRSLPAYRLLNAGAWGYAAFALLLYLLRDRSVGGRRGTLKTTAAGRPTLDRSAGAAAAAGVAVFAAAFLAAHPPADGLLSASPAVQTAIMVGTELVVAVLAVLVALRALARGRATASRPWRAYLRGFGTALLVLIPANLLDFGVSIALQAAGVEARDGLVFAAGYGIAALVLIVAIASGIRLTVWGDTVAVPGPMVDAFGITRREREIIEKLLEGKTDKRIAEELFISPRTVDTHLRSVFRKCNVGSRLQLTRLVSSYGDFRNSQ